MLCRMQMQRGVRRQLQLFDPFRVPHKIAIVVAATGQKTVNRILFETLGKMPRQFQECVFGKHQRPDSRLEWTAGQRVQGKAGNLRQRQ